ncbi:cytochrome P450 6k1-like [Penaeus chinensis]|uniref:cytochrome P450 6k1-like n=1 Tax=Penaeus chinensis TaxID=139456 RepID=UPI001FB72D12|nr:cytochrome P450 6k1-like [Penaeus chinensis]XP_047493755.1 cytochrome P450 6k1-like [Penaeus chinensis]
MITWALLAVLVVTALLYSRWRHSYWSSRGVPTAPGSIPFFGHTFKFLSRSKYRWLVVDEMYYNHRGSLFCGLYELFRPSLLLGDPDLLKAVLIKDFDHFANRRSFKSTNPKDKIVNEMITSATGEHWKGIRSVLSTSFTSGRMKGMFPLIEAKAQGLIDYLYRQLKKDPVVRMKHSFGMYTLEVISSCAFGLETNSFEGDDSIFAQKALELFIIKPLRHMQIMFLITFPKLATLLNIQLSHENMEFFTDVVIETMKQRKAGAKRGDFLDIMLEAREDQDQSTDKKKPKYPLSDDTIIASSVLFIIAGYDTTANTLGIASFLLAKHTKEQELLREELRKLIAEHGSLTYQAIIEAKYLEGCVSETLRMYPPVPINVRSCTMDYNLPGTDLVIHKGQSILIPVWSLHHDQKYWPDPEKFDPTRFFPENKDRIVSGTYLPFGLGPRNCIAMRFAQMEAKLALARTVLEFELRCAPGHEELEMSFTPGIMRPKEDVFVTLTPVAKE